MKDIAIKKDSAWSSLVKFLPLPEGFLFNLGVVKNEVKYLS